MSVIGNNTYKAPRQSTLVSSQPLDSEAGQIARGLVRATGIAPDQIDQVAHDLTAFPINWLKRFQEENVAVVVMKSDQNLADTPLWPTFTKSACEEMLTTAAPLVHKTVSDFMATFDDIKEPEEKAYHVRMAGDDLKEKFDTLSNDAGLGFSVKMTREPKNYEVLAAEHGVDTSDEEKLSDWKSAFQRLNDSLIEKDPDNAVPKHGFYLIPYEYYKDKPFRSLSLASLKSITGMELSLHDGANYPENHFITIHENVVPDPSPHMGHHRVVLHESGHMVDWITKDLPGVGPGHEKKVLELFEKAHKSDPGDGQFLSARAKDSAGEFFADAVEAYLTLPVDDGKDHYKAENNRIEMQKRNPELFNYIDWIMKL